MKIDDTVYALQPRRGDFYTHLFERHNAPLSLCGRERSEFYSASERFTAGTALLPWRMDICASCARELRARVAE